MISVAPKLAIHRWCLRRQVVGSAKSRRYRISVMPEMAKIERYRQYTEVRWGPCRYNGGCRRKISMMPKLAMRKSMMMLELAVWLVLLPKATIRLLVFSRTCNLVFVGFAFAVCWFYLWRQFAVLWFLPERSFRRCVWYFPHVQFFRVIGLLYTGNL